MWNLILAASLAAEPKIDGTEGCVGEQAGYPLCSFGLVIEAAPGSSRVTLHSQQNVGKEGNHTKWKELASITLTADPARRMVVNEACEYKGKPDDTIVALTPNFGPDDPEMIQAVDWAYRIDLPSGKFVAIDPRDVRCGNTDIGAD